MAAAPRTVVLGYYRYTKAEIAVFCWAGGEFREHAVGTGVIMGTQQAREGPGCADSRMISVQD